MSWISLQYEPKRWMRREAYYKARSLWRKGMRAYWKRFWENSTGEIGIWYGVRFIEDIDDAKS